MTMAPHVKAAADLRRGTGFVGEMLSELESRGAAGMTVAEARAIWETKYEVKTVLSRLLASGRATREDGRYFFVRPEIKTTPQVFRSLATLEAMQSHARKIYTGYAQVR